MGVDLYLFERDVSVTYIHCGNKSEDSGGRYVPHNNTWTSLREKQI